MSDLLTTILSFPPAHAESEKDWDKQAIEYTKSISKVAGATWSKAIQKQNILDLLNPAVNSIAYLFALSAQCYASAKDREKNEELGRRSLIFFTSFDPEQIRYAGTQWLKLMDWAFEVWPRLGITDFYPLTTAMLRLDPTAGTFTSSHLNLLRASLTAGAPSQALHILDKTIYACPQTPSKVLPEEPLNEQQDLSNGFITANSGFSAKLKPEHLLEYYLLGAHIYIGHRNFSRARLFLELVLLTPTLHHATSALQVEAYKKWLLVGLVAEGKRLALPRGNDQQVVKTVAACSKAYETLAEDFERRQWRKYQADVDAGMQLWNDDGNLGLIAEATDALLRYRIIDLSKTYAALPVSRVAASLALPPEHTQKVLVEMIRQRALEASITTGSDASNGAVLRFHFSSGDAVSADDLEAQTKRLEDLITFVRDADRRLQLTKEYVEYNRRNKRSGASPEGDIADQMDLTYDAPIVMENDGEEEDIMA